jgi:hypothetical protein
MNKYIVTANTLTKTATFSGWHSIKNDIVEQLEKTQKAGLKFVLIKNIVAWLHSGYYVEKIQRTRLLKILLINYGSE